MKSADLMRPRPVVSRWKERQPMPNFLTDRLPGEWVELEYVRRGKVRKIRVRLGCQTDGDSCPFSNTLGR